MIYVWIGLAIAVLIALGYMFKQWNSGRVADAQAERQGHRAEQTDDRQEQRTYRVWLRRCTGWFGRRNADLPICQDKPDIEDDDNG